MSDKVPGSCQAVGYWGGCSPYERIALDQTADKIKALLQDKLIALGRPAYLWLPVNDDTPGVIACTCDKDTTQSSDFRCYSCYGTRFAPGFLRFMHETIYAASAEYASFTLSSVVRDTTIKPNRLRLAAGALTGTIETGDKAFSNTEDADWEFQVAAFRKVATDDIGAEFSTDSGASWDDLVDINGPNKPTGTGTIRFRVTLTRSAATTDSPDFEILRVRHPQPDLLNDVVAKPRPDLIAGQILVLRTWSVEATMRAMGRGRLTEWSQDQGWTMGLSFFDTSRTPDTIDDRIIDRDAGPHPFLEYRSGVITLERTPLTSLSYDDNIQDTFQYQLWSDRRSQDGEVYYLIW